MLIAADITSNNLLLLCVLCAVGSQPALSDDQAKITSPQQQFSTELLQTIAANSSYTKNVFFSPYSIYSSLLIAYLASAGKTAKSLEHLMRFDSNSKPAKAYINKTFLDGHNEIQSKEYELKTVIKIFYTPDVRLVPNAGFGPIVAEFKTNNEVNALISKDTNGKIKDLLEEGVPGFPTIYFVNAAYFKGYWTVPLTGIEEMHPFTLPDGSKVNALMMSAQENRTSFKLLTDAELDAQIISLPYKGNDLLMIIILPKTIPKAVQKLTSSKFKQIVSALQTQKEEPTDVWIPKFQSSEKYELKPIFEKLGDKDLFTQEADFSNLFEPLPGLIVKKIVHEAKVNVHENGTEAAAATGMIGTLGVPPPNPHKFRADHPFIYIIYDHTSSFIHYMGLLSNPVSK